MALTIVNAVKGSGIGTSAVSPALTTAVGDLLLVHCIDAVDFTNLVDSKGNAPAAVVTLQNLTSWGNGARVLAVPVVTGGTGHTLTFHKSGSGFPVIQVIQLRGQAASAPVDTGSLVTARQASNTISITSAALAQADSMVFAFAMTDGTSPDYGNTSGFTKVVEEADGNNYWTGAAWAKAASSTSAVTFTDPNGGSPSFIDWTAAIFAVKAAATGHPIADAGGISSAETFGGPAVGAHVAPAAISSGSAIGAPSIGATIRATGIDSVQALGTPVLRAAVEARGVASGEKFGSPILRASIGASGISSSEAVGAPRLASSIHAAGIPAGEGVGSPAVSGRILGAGIASAEAFGRPTIGAVGISCVGIPSAEAFGVPAIGTYSLRRNERTYVVPAELRTFRPAVEDRVYTVPPEIRTYRAQP